MDDKKKQELKESSELDKKISANFAKILLDRAISNENFKKK